MICEVVCINWLLKRLYYREKICTGLSYYHYEKVEEAKKLKKELVFPQLYGYLDKLDVVVAANGGYLVNCGQVH
jgi:hypothetical protein